MRKRTIKKGIALTLTTTIFAGIFPQSFLDTFAKDNMPAEMVYAAQETEEDAYILYEHTDLREEYSKTYERSDGVNVQITTATPLHSYDEDTKTWKEIYQGVEETKETDGTVSFDAGYASVTMEGEDQSIRLEVGEKESRVVMTFLPEKEDIHVNAEITEVPDAQKDSVGNREKQDADETHDYRMNGFSQEEVIEALEDMQTQKDSVAFEQVSEHTDITYDFTARGLKESIIINEKPEESVTYTYAIEAQGLEAVLMPDKSIEFRDNAGKVQYIMPAPFMYDGIDARSIDIQVTLDKNAEGEYQLTYMPDMAWLQDEARVYPVVVDPTIESVQSSAVQDTYVNSGATTTNYGSTATTLVGNYASAYDYTMYVKTPVPSVPSGSVILSANLCMTQLDCTAEMTTAVYQVTGSWSETGVTYASQPTSGTEIYDYHTHTATTEDTVVSYDITRLYNEWYYGHATNYGVKIDAYGTVAGNSYVTFCADGQSDTAKYPYMVVEYRSADRLSNAGTTDITLDDRSTLYINDYTGTPILERTDMAYSGDIMPVTIKFLYNYNQVNKNYIGAHYAETCYGIGWVSNYSLKLNYVSKTVNGKTSDYYEFYSEDGSILYFDREIETSEITTETGADEIFVDATGSGYTLFVDTSDLTDYKIQKIKDEEGNTYYFDTLGRIVKIVGDYPVTEGVTATSNLDTKTNEAGVIRIDYLDSGSTSIQNSRRIKMITDGSGRKYQFNYDSSSRLSSISYLGTGTTALSTVTYTYDTTYSGIHPVASVTYADGSTVAYTTSSLKLTGINCNDGFSVELGYAGGRNRVTSVKEYGTDSSLLQDVSISYEVGQTTYTDNLSGDVKIMQFDTEGNCTSVRDDSGYAVFNQYSDSENGILVDTSNLIKSSTNLLMFCKTSGDVVADDTNTYLSSGKCYKIPAGNTLTGYGYLTEAGNYTVSAYVKTSDIIGGTGVYLEVEGTGVTVTESSPVLTGTGEYQRITMQMELTGNVSENRSMWGAGNVTIRMVNSATGGTVLLFGKLDDALVTTLNEAVWC